jgi:hypothetical protein
LQLIQIMAAGREASDCASPSKDLVPHANGGHRLTAMALGIEQGKFLSQRQPRLPQWNKARLGHYFLNVTTHAMAAKNAIVFAVQNQYSSLRSLLSGNFALCSSNHSLLRQLVIDSGNRSSLGKTLLISSFILRSVMTILT